MAESVTVQGEATQIAREGWLWRVTLACGHSFLGDIVTVSGPDMMAVLDENELEPRDCPHRSSCAREECCYAVVERELAHG